MTGFCLFKFADTDVSKRKNRGRIQLIDTFLEEKNLKTLVLLLPVFDKSTVI